MTTNDVFVDTSDGFVDFRFPILSSAIAKDGEAVFVVGGSLLGRSVEITFRVRAGILPSDFSAEPPIVEALSDGITMSLIGEEGQNFALSLSELYRSSRSSFLVPLQLSFTAVALQGNPAEIAKEAVKFKLFHETGSTDEEEGPEYFEMFFNVDLASGIVSLNEKDTDFRSGVLSALPPALN
jgi:hypothetical protein